MSKYLMNKLIHLVNMNQEAEEQYTATRVSSSRIGRKLKS